MINVNLLLTWEFVYSPFKLTWAFRLIWWAYSKGRLHCPSIIVHHTSSSTLFKHLLLGNRMANQSHGMGEQKFVQTVQVTWPRWPPCPCMVKKLLRNQKADDLERWYVASGAPVLPRCSNDDPELTLTYFTARSNLVPYAFVWEKGKTMDFSETTVVYDLKPATDDQSDKKFLLTSKFCPQGVSAHSPGLYTCIKS